MTSQGTLPLSLQGLYGELGDIVKGTRLTGLSLITAVSVDMGESQVWQVREEKAFTI